MPPRAAARPGRVLPFPHTPSLPPAEALRRFVLLLARGIAERQTQDLGTESMLAGAMLGDTLRPDWPPVSSALRRKLERRFVAALIEEAHRAERAEECRAKLARAAGWRPKPPRGAA